MISVTVVAVLCVLAVATQVGVLVFERKYPPTGELVDVTGGRLHVVQIGPRDASGPPIVLIHGATSSMETMWLPLGNMLAEKHRVIMIDRPGFGWSTRDDLSNSSPAMQARMIDEALGKLGIDRAIVVVHSLAGALGALMAYTITLPLGYFLTDMAGRAVFAPQIMPAGYISQAATQLVLRPRNFLANAWDLVTLKSAVMAQASRYADIKAPTVVITGSADTIVSPEIHSRHFAKTVPGAKLIVLPNVGHMVQNAAPDLIMREIEGMISAADTKPKAALR